MRHASGTANYVMYIRYEDRYQRDSGAWKVAERVVRTSWTELRPTDAPLDAAASSSD